MSQNAVDEDTSLYTSGLDALERRLFEAGHRADKEYTKWLRRGYVIGLSTSAARSLGLTTHFACFSGWTRSKWQCLLRRRAENGNEAATQHSFDVPRFRTQIVTFLSFSPSSTKNQTIQIYPTRQQQYSFRKSKFTTHTIFFRWCSHIVILNNGRSRWPID